MISDYSSTLDTGNVEVLVIDKPESATISPRLLELRKKIYDEEYLDNADETEPLNFALT